MIFKDNDEVTVFYMNTLMLHFTSISKHTYDINESVTLLKQDLDEEVLVLETFHVEVHSVDVLRMCQLTLGMNISTDSHSFSMKYLYIILCFISHSFFGPF